MSDVTRCRWSEKGAMQFLFGRFLLVIVGLWLMACDAHGPAESAQEHDSVTVSTDAVNYMHDWGLGYTLFNQADNQPVGGGILGFLEGPGGKGCCLKLPKKWKPGMQVRVEWQKSDKKMTEETMRIKVLEIPEYDKPGDLYVAFYPGDEVEIVVSWAEPGHPEWRGREREPPYASCVAKNTRKICEKNLPKYAPASHERIAAMARRACQPAQVKKASDPLEEEDLCKKWVERCKKEKLVDTKMCDIDYKEDE